MGENEREGAREGKEGSVSEDDREGEGEERSVREGFAKDLMLQDLGTPGR